MKIFTWCTDIHLDFIDKSDRPLAVEKFARHINDIKASGIFITGDISLAPDLVRHLKIIDSVVNKPIYFVCGNHDMWGADVASVRTQLVDMCKNSANLKYLTAMDHVSLTKKTALVGHDGWYDAYYGDPFRSNYVMVDWFKIGDFINAGVMGTGMYGPKPNVPVAVGLSRQWASVAADHVAVCADRAAKTHQNVVVLTHVPPFPEVHKYKGQIGDASAMPWYTSKLMGDALIKVARDNPQTKFEVFCGHTHGKAKAQVADNVFCRVGGSQYGAPQAAGTLSFP